MASLTGIECSAALLNTLRAAWVVHADFTSRGTVIEAPRLMDVELPTSGDELVSLSSPGVEFREVTAATPRATIQDIKLLVAVLVESEYPATDPSGDPAALILAKLQPLAVTVQKRIEIDLRLLRDPVTPTALSAQFHDWTFDDYVAGVDKDGGRLQGLGLFTYSVGFWIPDFFDTSLLDDLNAGDIDYNLYGGVGDVIFPDAPHAEDDETLP